MQRKYQSWFPYVLLVLSLVLLSCQVKHKVSLRDECMATLSVLCEALYRLQITEIQHPGFGAIRCPACQVFHTRAAEAVYPFAVLFKNTQDPKYAEAARRLGNWLIRQQLADGSWQETPEKWTGTTTDQLLMMVMAWDILKDQLSEAEQGNWITAMHIAADYLSKVMDASFASINYCATTAATLAMMNRCFPNERWLQKAQALAMEVASKMDGDGFIGGEGERVYGEKYGVDIGYELDMSLWGLGLYARLTKDAMIDSLVRHSLRTHLYFVYPNGAIDAAWGIRSNKWTTYGSKTADGCQILFSLFASVDPRYRTAAMENLIYLRTMIKDGMIGYGPHYWEIFDVPPCIYPTFARAKNLAMAVEWGEQQPGILPPLPTEQGDWIRLFPTVDVVQVRTKSFMTTISAYRYKDLNKRDQGKYMHRPSGGSICNLWVEGHGFLQLASQTEYHRWEPMHFPEIKDILPLTPRIEFSNENGYFTNLYEFDSRLQYRATNKTSAFVVTTAGELTDRHLLPGGIAYQLSHKITDHTVEKTVTLRYHGGSENVRIVEPIVHYSDMKFTQVDDRRVQIQGAKRAFYFEVIDGDVILKAGEGAEKCWAVFPSVKCFPIVLYIHRPERGFLQQVTYRLRIAD